MSRNELTLHERYPQIAAFQNLPNCRSTIVGVAFAAKAKSGNRQIFFLTFSREKAPERLFRWVPVKFPGESYWKECPLAGLSEKKRAELVEFWQSQADIGLWISESRRLAG